LKIAWYKNLNLFLPTKHKQGNGFVQRILLVFTNHIFLIVNLIIGCSESSDKTYILHATITQFFGINKGLSSLECLPFLMFSGADGLSLAHWLVELCKSDRIRSDFGTKILISDRIDKVVS
jgi:hypothetical protein